MAEREQSESRRRTIRLLDAWFTFAAASVLLCWYATFAARSLLDTRFAPYRVLGSFYISGWAASHHWNPYGLYPLMWHFKAYPQGPPIYDVNLNPPCVLPLFQLLAHFSVRSDVIAWTVLSTLLMLATAAILLAARGGSMQKRQIVWLLLSTSVLDTLWFGQDYALATLLVCLVWLLTRSTRETLTALLIGAIVAMRPNLGLWCVLLLAAGYKRPAILSAATATALSILPVFLYGPGVYAQWFRADLEVPHWLFPSDVSLAGVFARLGLWPVGTLLATALAVALIVFVRRLRPSQTDVAGIAICAGILCAPLAWYNYLLFAAPLFVTKRWKALETCAAVLMTVPRLFGDRAMGGSRLLVAVAGLPQLAGICLMLVAFLRRARSNARPIPRPGAWPQLRHA